ncbi:transcriptional adapter 3-A [Trichonephila clavipes]|nr:transcriptional adapter 3-A [Trichonephila clavipes]
MNPLKSCSLPQRGKGVFLGGLGEVCREILSAGRATLGMKANPLFPVKNAVLQRRNIKNLRMDGLQAVRFELENELISAIKRKKQLENKIFSLETLHSKKDKETVPSRKDKRSKSTDSIEKKNSDERPPKKSKDSSNKAHSSSNHQKNKYIPPDPHQEIPKPLKNDAPSRFWSCVEPYCADITQDTIRAIEDWIAPQESDKDYEEIPELGEHFSETWPLEDLKEEMIEVNNKISICARCQDYQASSEHNALHGSHKITIDLELAEHLSSLAGFPWVKAFPSLHPIRGEGRATYAFLGDLALLELSCFILQSMGTDSSGVKKGFRGRPCLNPQYTAAECTCECRFHKKDADPMWGRRRYSVYYVCTNLTHKLAKMSMKQTSLESFLRKKKRLSEETEMSSTSMKRVNFNRQHHEPYLKYGFVGTGQAPWSTLKEKNGNKGQKKFMRATTSIKENAPRASYLVANRIAKAKKPFTIGEELILLATKDICRELLGEAAVEKISHVPLSTDT